MPNNLDLDILWGARQIAAALNLSERQCFHKLESGQLPAKKIGGRWVMARQAIAQMFLPAADNSPTV